MTVADPLNLLAIPTDPGCYLLVIRADRLVALTVGRLGPRTFPRGWHVYVGSARRGLRARLRHHIQPDRPAHWHVDGLRRAGRLTEIWLLPGPEAPECALAGALAALPGGRRSPSFGSSDCRCPGHLVSFTRKPLLGALWPGLTRLRAQPRTHYS